VKISTYILLPTLWLLLILPSTTKAQASFKGKTIEWIVPFKRGGGADTWARFNAPYLSKYLPGNPKVIVKNFPGSGSIKADNAYAKNTKADGLTLLGTSASTKLPYLLGDQRVKYDFKQWQALLISPTGGVVYASADLGVKVPADIKVLRDKKLVYGSQGATSLDMVQQLGFDLLDLKVSTFFGLRGRSAGQYAFEKGLANIDFQTTAAYIKNVLPIVEQGIAIPLYSMGILNNDGELIRDPQFPELPTILEVYASLEGQKPTGEHWDNLFSLFSVAFGVQKFLVLPQSTPQNIIDSYYLAFEKMFADLEYQQMKNKVLGAYEQKTGNTAVRLYHQSIQTPSSKQWIQKWLQQKFNIKIK